eukprot:5146976-Ditylum_brightwellii.AAC.1
MVFTAEGLIETIYGAITTKWPTGKACLVVVALQKKYAPKDLVSKIEMKHELNAITMKKVENPAYLFKKISELENCYNTSLFCISLDNQITTVLTKAPVEYSTVLTCEQRSKGRALTMLDLEEAMS